MMIIDDKGTGMNSGEDKEVSMAKTVLKKMVGGFRRILSREDFSPEPKNIGLPMNIKREFHVTVNDDGSTNGLPASLDKYYRVSE